MTAIAAMNAMNAIRRLASAVTSHLSHLSLLSLLSLLLLGCTRLAATYDTAPNGLIRAEDQFRRFLAAGRADSALLQLAASKAQLPGDPLLRALFEGIAAHHNGDHERSADAFELASLVAEDRTTRSVSRAALSLVVNDLSLAYEPSRTELLLLPYYAALNYVAVGDYGEAAVEARRLSARLQAVEEKDKYESRELYAFLRYFAGVLFEAAGERGDADVAYRNALALDSVAPPDAPNDSTGDIIVIVERSFVPHRVQESLFLPLTDTESHELDRDRDEDERRDAASQVAERVLAFVNSAGPRTGVPSARTLWVPAPTSSKAAHTETRCDSAGKCHEEHEDHSYLLRLSWPMMFAPPTAPGSLRVLVDSTAATPVARADLASGVLEDFRREQPAIITRAIARAAAKYAITKSAEKSAGKKHEALGDVVGALANVAGALTEQADLRSWHLLPRNITLMRIRLPAGHHRLRIDTGAGATRDAGPVTVRAGRLAIVGTRLWD